MHKVSLMLNISIDFKVYKYVLFHLFQSNFSPWILFSLIWILPTLLLCLFLISSQSLSLSGVRIFPHNPYHYSPHFVSVWFTCFQYNTGFDFYSQSEIFFSLNREFNLVTHCCDFYVWSHSWHFISWFVLILFPLLSFTE